MKNLYRKSVIITVIALFLTICLSPMIAANTIKENNEDIIFEFSTVGLKNSNSVQQISISENEFIELKNKLSDIMEEIRMQTNEEDTIDLLKSYLNVNEYPILLSNLSILGFILVLYPLCTHLS